MNRKYTVKQFIELCNYIRLKNPLASITTDYIVGYNNETEKIFKDCIDNLKIIDFSYMNIFPYSIRQKTKGSFEKNQVETKTKFIRVKKIQSIADSCTKKYLDRFINKTVNVWFERSNCKDIQSGHSEFFFKVYVRTKKNLHSQLLKVLITKNENNKLFGKII